MPINKISMTVLLVAIIASVALTRYYWPKVVERTVEVEKEVLKTDIRTITKIVERKDGTKETVIDSTDRSTRHSEASKTIEIAQSEWLGGVGAITGFEKLEPVFNISVSKRLIGPFFVGLQADTSSKIGVLVTVEF